MKEYAAESQSHKCQNRCCEESIDLAEIVNTEGTWEELEITVDSLAIDPVMDKKHAESVPVRPTKRIGQPYRVANRNGGRQQRPNGLPGH